MSEAAIDVTFLLSLSLASLVTDVGIRKWPERAQAIMARFDGSSLLLRADLHLRLVKLSGLGLIATAYLALAVAAIAPQFA